MKALAALALVVTIVATYFLVQFLRRPFDTPHAGGLHVASAPSSTTPIAPTQPPPLEPAKEEAPDAPLVADLDEATLAHNDRIHVPLSVIGDLRLELQDTARAVSAAVDAHRPLVEVLAIVAGSHERVRQKSAGSSDLMPLGWHQLDILEARARARYNAAAPVTR